MTCEIIELSTFTRPSRSVSDKRPLGQRLREAKPELPPPATETAKNSRIRIKRRDASGKDVETVVDYKRILSGKDPDPTLKANDVVVIKESFF